LRRNSSNKVETLLAPLKLFIPIGATTEGPLIFGIFYFLRSFLDFVDVFLKLGRKVIINNIYDFVKYHLVGGGLVSGGLVGCGLDNKDVVLEKFLDILFGESNFHDTVLILVIVGNGIEIVANRHPVYVVALCLARYRRQSNNCFLAIIVGREILGDKSYQKSIEGGPVDSNLLIPLLRGIGEAKHF
jgi:hypothetical protein